MSAEDVANALADLRDAGMIVRTGGADDDPVYSHTELGDAIMEALGQYGLVPGAVVGEVAAAMRAREARNVAELGRPLTPFERDAIAWDCWRKAGVPLDG